MIAPGRSADPAHAEAVAPGVAADQLSAGDIHLWWLDYDARQGRRPLLTLLGAYVRQSPERLALHAGPHGRPALPPEHALDFNWSHSGARALVAVARATPILGVDVEALLRRRLDPMALAERYFTPMEQTTLAALAEADRRDAFRRLWTAKEAVLKAEGHGLSYGLSRVGFERVQGCWRPLDFVGPIGAAASWQLLDWPVAHAHASLAWRGPARTVRHLRMPG